MQSTATLVPSVVPTRILANVVVALLAAHGLITAANPATETSTTRGSRASRLVKVRSLVDGIFWVDSALQLVLKCPCLPRGTHGDNDSKKKESVYQLR